MMRVWMLVGWSVHVAVIRGLPTIIGRRVVIGVPTALLVPFRALATPQLVQQRCVWEFSNGSVVFDIPFVVCDGTLSFDTFALLGSGGGGAVFVASSMHSRISGTSSLSRKEAVHKASPAVVKVSWTASSASVQQECTILRRLASRGITKHVEQCLEVKPYRMDPTRTVAILQPVFTEEQVSSIADIPNPSYQRRAVLALVETTVRLITQAQVVTTDVQVLISRQSGDLLWIDFTEAIVMQSPPTFSDLAVAKGMLNEVAAMIPENLKSFALVCINEERKKGGVENQPSDLADLIEDFQELNET